MALSYPRENRIIRSGRTSDGGFRILAGEGNPGGKKGHFAKPRIGEMVPPKPVGQIWRPPYKDLRTLHSVDRED